MSINVPLPGQERKIVMVYLPPNGEPKPCYEDSLHIARDQGYVKYEPTDASASQVIVPDETSEDRMAREERAREEIEKRASQFLAELGITRLPNAECESCTGLGAVFSDETVPRPCFACFPEAMELVPPGGAGSGKDDGRDDVGGENGGTIVGAPDGTTTTVGNIPPAGTTVKLDSNTPASCNMAGCHGLCGICAPPKRVSVSEGRELNRNRKKLGKKPLKIDGGKVHAEE